ncbi:putative reverse transcriptase domain, reverse transcriptase zinc-binding domain protein [Tanacetum coccineum]
MNILNLMPFSEGELPTKYLGVPLISSRLLNRYCKILVESAKNRIEDWKNKSLSFAGRLQLGKSVISSMHVYWVSVLAIPKGILYDIQALICGFLWCNGDYKRGKAEVAWGDICLPTSEGGLGLRSLKLFNKALMTKHIWNIVTNKESLWVRWIYAYKIKGRSFWAIPLNDAEMSWGWQKILQLRDRVRPFIWTKIGNGLKASAWYDIWDPQCPLINHLSPRDIAREGHNLQSHVAALVSNGGWSWPQQWLLKAPNLNLVIAPNLDTNSCDSYFWCDSNENQVAFSVKCVWESIRPRGNEVPWFNTVWFSHCIPRHAFHLWLVMRNSLRTQDKLRLWDIGDNADLSLLKCPLCESIPDSHNYLFFECNFSIQVWVSIRRLADMDGVPPSINAIMSYLQPFAKSRKAKSVIAKLLVAAASYFIWNERNNRLFKNVRRKHEEIRDMVMVTVRLKLLTFRFKNNYMVNHLLDRWKMPSNFRLYGS